MLNQLLTMALCLSFSSTSLCLNIKEHKPFKLLELPGDLITEIFQYLSLIDLVHLAMSEGKALNILVEQNIKKNYSIEPKFFKNLMSQKSEFLKLIGELKVVRAHLNWPSEDLTQEVMPFLTDRLNFKLSIPIIDYHPFGSRFNHKILKYSDSPILNFVYEIDFKNLNKQVYLLMEFLEKNAPQLKNLRSLTIYGCINKDDILSLARSAPYLKNLDHLCLGSMDPEATLCFINIARGLSNIKSFRLGYDKYYGQNDNLMPNLHEIIFEMPKLVNLFLGPAIRIELNNPKLFLNHLKSLELCYINDDSLLHLPKIIKGMPQLKKLYLKSTKIEKTNLKKIIKCFYNLEVLGIYEGTFKIIGRNHRNDAIKYLSKLHLLYIYNNLGYLQYKKPFWTQYGLPNCIVKCALN